MVDSAGEIILFIDEIHTLVGAGRSSGAMDASNILKPALARGELRTIGSTTLDEYQKYFETDKALERRFQMVLVDEPSPAKSIAMMRGLKEKSENHHRVKIEDRADRRRQSFTPVHHEQVPAGQGHRPCGRGRVQAAFGDELRSGAYRRAQQ